MSDEQKIDNQTIYDSLKSLAGNVSLEELAKFLPLRPGDITMMFTDIKGSTRLKNLSESRDDFYFREIMSKHDDLMQRWIAQCDGYVLDTAGDGYFAGFQSSRQALKCAVGIQQELADASTSIPTPDKEHLQVRIGLHTGEAKVHKNKTTGRIGLVGNDVDKAARICSLADGEQLFISDETRSLVEKTSPALKFHSHSLYELKGLGQHSIIEVLWPNKQARRPRNGIRSLNKRFLTQFVGRRNEIAQLCVDLHDYRLVTLVGSGGVGKSRLAYEVALQLQTSPLFPHGCADVMLEDLTKKTRESVIKKFIADLHLTLPETLIAANDTSYDALMMLLIEELRQQQVLILIDNCEIAPESVAAIVKSLLEGCPLLRILASSQTPLGLKNVEKIAFVRPMLLPNADAFTHEGMKQLDSYRLFRQRATLNPGLISDDQDHEFEELNANDLACLLKLTEGLPLVLEIVAAWMRYEDIDDIVEDLAQSPLGEKSGATPGARDILAAERHQSMTDCIKWSVDLLEPPYQNDFAQLGILERMFSSTDVNSTCILQNNVLDLLRKLLGNSLVMKMNDNYLLSRFVQAYAVYLSRNHKPNTGQPING